MWSHWAPRPRGPAWFALVTGEWGSHRVCREFTTQEPAPPVSPGTGVWLPARGRVASRPGLCDSGLIPGALLAGETQRLPLCLAPSSSHTETSFPWFSFHRNEFRLEEKEELRLTGRVPGQPREEGVCRGGPVTGPHEGPAPRLRAGAPPPPRGALTRLPRPPGTGPASPHGPVRRKSH